ncbi:MAG: glycosyltransferase [Hydrogenophilus sp.]|nr:glycosyltransferase [Hydrogenophilus sp.]
MNILFIHQNFPGQFRHLAPALAARGHTVVATTLQKVPPSTWKGVRILPYTVARGTTPNVHPWVSDFEAKVIRAEAFYRHARQIAADGFTPDLIIAHPGWGESLFVKEVWPTAKLAIYCEFYYHPTGADVGFDPEFDRADPAEACRLRLKNSNNLHHFEIADAGISPTHWQASTFPNRFRSKITVIHDGIDTVSLTPNPNATITLTTHAGTRHLLTRRDELITFVNRNLEPYRGWHIFARALPELLRRRPTARVLIVGGNSVSYGAPPDPQRYGGHTSWRDILTAEIRPQISDSDWERVHFLGYLPYSALVSLLQTATVHVYLTYPFVLSWSLLEAMSLGCAIVASDTTPVREVITHAETGWLVPFFDSAALVDAICKLLDAPAERHRLGQQARHHVQTHYDLTTVSLPRQIAWAEGLVS